MRGAIVPRKCFSMGFERTPFFFDFRHTTPKWNEILRKYRKWLIPEILGQERQMCIKPKPPQRVCGGVSEKYTKNMRNER